MADEGVYSAGGESNKRKYEDSPTSVGRRASGFSSLPDSAAPPTYSTVPPVNEIELAKQKAQEIAARLLNNVDPSKRARVENGAGVGGGFDSIDSGITQKHYGGLGLGGPPQSGSYGYPGPSKKIEIPNGRVGVIIGKGGETIKYLQLQSGAKIQVTRDMDADPNSATRGVDLMGTPDQIAKAEQLINEVLSEADVGGSGIVSRRLTGQPSGAEQYVTKIPNNKVGLVIGKGGETIKNMQASTGARIQVIPLHLPPGDMSKERTLQIDGTSEQIEAAKQLVDEVISEGLENVGQSVTPTWAHVMLVFPRHRSGRGWDSAGVIQYYNPISTNRMRNQTMSGGYSQQGYQAKPPSNWAQPGPPAQQPGYGYVQPGAYPGPPQYNMNQQPYSAYPSQPTSGWDQSAAPNQQSGGYDYYNHQAPPQSQGAPSDGSGYGYSRAPAPAPAYSQGQGYGQDGYGGGYHTGTTAQSGHGQQSQPGYDQQGYNSTYSGASNPTADRQTPSLYGEPTQAPAPAQPSPNPNYPHQGSGQPGYGAPPSYGTQPPSYGNYGTPPAQKYAQPQQSPSASAQPGYTQMDSGVHRPPSSQTGYYGAQSAAAAAQGYPPQYNTAAYGGGYSQPPPAYSSDGGVACGTYDTTPPQSTGPAKASPPS